MFKEEKYGLDIRQFHKFKKLKQIEIYARHKVLTYIIKSYFSFSVIKIKPYTL